MVARREVVDWIEGGEDIDPLLEIDERPPSPLHLPDHLICVYADDEDVAAPFCLAEETDVARVDEVEATETQDDAFALVAEAGADDAQVARRPEFALARHRDAVQGSLSALLLMQLNMRDVVASAP